eukprot:c22044_g1_i1 orf=561-1874(-)
MHRKAVRAQREEMEANRRALRWRSHAPRLCKVELILIIIVGVYCCGFGADKEEAQLELDEQLYAPDYEALQAVRSSLADLPGSSFFDTWNFNTSAYAVYPCTSFMGLICDYVDGVLRVRQLNLGTGLADSPGLTGSLHPAIAHLTALQQLTLAPGQVGGHLPHSIGALQELQFLGISRNQISGSLPPTLASLQSLQTLDLSYNNLRGPLPPSLLRLPNLQALLLSHNRLFGPIFSISSPLLHLDLQQNTLSGPLPASFPSSLSFLSLANNKLSGSITSLAPLVNLYFLDLSFNKLTGNLPPQLLGLNLHSLILQRNHLWGSVEPPSLVSMETLDLSFNDFSGPLSPFLCTASNLYLNNNRFTGEVPQEYADQLLSGDLMNLYLQHNLVTQFMLDPRTPLPLTSSLCIDFNCMETPSQSHCPDTVAADKSVVDNQCGH